MKKLFCALGLIAFGITTCLQAYAVEDVVAKTKKVCHDRVGKDGKTVKDKKGEVVRDCKTIKIHKKLEPTKDTSKK